MDSTVWSGLCTTVCLFMSASVCMSIYACHLYTFSIFCSLRRRIVYVCVLVLCVCLWACVCVCVCVYECVAFVACFHMQEAALLAVVVRTRAALPHACRMLAACMKCNWISCSCPDRLKPRRGHTWSQEASPQDLFQLPLNNHQSRWGTHSLNSYMA